MNYYIDFEATQFSNEIISVGVIREDGETFYSLVRSKKKLTQFIMDLTHLTQEQIDAAPEPDEVFANLYDWCETDGCAEARKFFCYGDTDKTFIRSTYNKTTNFKAAAMLGFLYAGLIDYSPFVKNHFGLHKNIGLMKVANYYRGEEYKQRHDALEDAELLKYVVEQVESHEDEFDAFPEYQIEKAVKEVKAPPAAGSSKKDTNAEIIAANKILDGECRIHRMKKGKIVDTYSNLQQAIKWCYDEIPGTAEQKQADLTNIGKRIRNAAVNKKQYFKFRWVIERIGE